MKLSDKQHAKRQKVAHSPCKSPTVTNHHANTSAGSYVAPAPITPKPEESCGTPPLPNSKCAVANQTGWQLEQCSQPMQTNTKSGHVQADTQQNSIAAAGSASQFRGNLKRIKDAKTFQRQKERRQKKAAFLLDGTTTGPVVGVAKGGSWGQAAQQHPVRLQGGQSVQLPVRPNRCASTAQLHARPSQCIVLLIQHNMWCQVQEIVCMHHKSLAVLSVCTDSFPITRPVANLQVPQHWLLRVAMWPAAAVWTLAPDCNCIAALSARLA